MLLVGALCSKNIKIINLQVTTAAVLYSIVVIEIKIFL